MGPALFWGMEFLGHLGVRTRKHRCMVGVVKVGPS